MAGVGREPWQVRGEVMDGRCDRPPARGSLSFDGLVELYDETRVYDPGCFAAALEAMVERFPPAQFGRLFEPGIGTGRIAIPLAERGYRVTGVDISEEMLLALQRRLAALGRPLAVCSSKADATRLPFADGVFDLAVAVHLFYFIAEWRRAACELMRVLRGDGAIILLHTGTGMEIPELNERYKALCEEQGCPIAATGVRSTAEVVAYYEGLGCTAEWVRDRWRWTARVPLDRALGYMSRRAYSFTTVAPQDVHRAAMERLAEEARATYGSLAAEVEVPNQVYLVAVTRCAPLAGPGDSQPSR